MVAPQLERILQECVLAVHSLTRLICAPVILEDCHKEIVQKGTTVSSCLELSSLLLESALKITRSMVLSFAFGHLICVEV